MVRKIAQGEQVVGVFNPHGSQQYEGMYPQYWEEVEMEGEDFDGMGQEEEIPRTLEEPEIQYRYRKTPRYAIPRPVTPTIMDALKAERLEKARKIEGMALRPTIDDHIVKPEPFAISSITGSPGAVTLAANTVNVRTLIGTYTIPTGYRFVFDPDDPYQEVLFTPFSTVGTTDTSFIVGNFDVTLEAATGGDIRRIFHSSTLWMRPGSNIASVGHLRKWQHKYVGVPGDLVRFYFTAAAVFSTTNSVLEARLRAGKVIL